MKLTNTHKALAFAFAITLSASGQVFGAAGLPETIRDLNVNVTASNVCELALAFRAATRNMVGENNAEHIAQTVDQATRFLDQAMLLCTADNFQTIKSTLRFQIVSGLRLDLQQADQAEALMEKLNTTYATFGQVQQAQEQARLAARTRAQMARDGFNHFASSAKNKISSLFSRTEPAEEIDTRTFAEAMAEQYAQEEAARAAQEPADQPEEPAQDPVTPSRCSFSAVWNAMTSKWMLVPAGFVVAYFGGAYDMATKLWSSDAPAPVTGTEDNLDLPSFDANPVKDAELRQHHLANIEAQMPSSSSSNSSIETPKPAKSAIELEADEMKFVDKHGNPLTGMTLTAAKIAFISNELARRQAAAIKQAEQARLEEQDTCPAHEILATCDTDQDTHTEIGFRRAQVKRMRHQARAAEEAGNKTASTQPSAEPAPEQVIDPIAAVKADVQAILSDVVPTAEELMHDADLYQHTLETVQNALELCNESGMFSNETQAAELMEIINPFRLAAIAAQQASVETPVVTEQPQAYSVPSMSGFIYKKFFKS
ncbi:hypothetical protein K2W90_03535 [Candidatus Babeliales bacterium]|nr:hypothetical protein [Candidatus Babeliales bacterium]